MFDIHRLCSGSGFLRQWRNGVNGARNHRAPDFATKCLFLLSGSRARIQAGSANSSKKANNMRMCPDVITTVDLPSGAVQVDGHGYLTDPDKWTVDFAEYIAEKEGITLTPQHFEVIDYVRNSEADHGVMPDVRHVLKYLAKRDGLSKSGSKAAMYALFPYGYVKQTIKIAGMKQPRAWSTG
jgi:tRNA 2-thiouridine synthesizing protein E